MGPNNPQGACGLAAAGGGREHWPGKVAVRLVCALDCSFLSKEDLTLKGGLMLGLGY